MIESRDRLIREEDPLTPMSGGRSPVGISRFSTGGERNLFGSGSPSRTTSSVMGFSGSSMGLMAMAASRNLAMRRVGYGTSRLGYGRGRNLLEYSSLGSENINPSGTGRRCRGRAIERRRNRLREAERHRLANLSPQEPTVRDPTLPTTGASLEHKISLTSPIPTASVKDSPSTVAHFPKILLKDQCTSESDFLTPQKKLLNSIDEVEKVVMKEFQRIQKTPIARKVEREKKVRKLMSMR
ncbi:hypothetical protein BVC80_8655g7 [Macleaya cordata]|uniref:Uncharacterized protein n=1 Tax=Macleaya cordata TaxID=56857 RepID=A0A200Q2X1_MACCD|nr:hypothetical protein BVC80_8655g7 [Macleaya cordata]